MDTNSPNPAIDRAIQKGGGLTALARTINATKGQIFQWRVRGQVPAEYCPSVEAATGESRKDLRPDDWERIWPELADKAEAVHE